MSADFLTFIRDDIELQTAQVFLKSAMIFTRWIPFGPQTAILLWIIVIQFGDNFQGAFSLIV